MLRQNINCLASLRAFLMYKIFYHKLVLSKDFKKVPKGDLRKIINAIHKKLFLSPETFGKPLQSELKGYFRLRIDPYRVIYRIEKERIFVFIVQIGLRKDFIVYLEAAKRLGLM